jgi:NAD(P)-dependent dehydrogenase (short-subunit alcohol dehydrogenase family)
MDFSGKHVVVTGGTGALGSAVVGELLTSGARTRAKWPKSTRS